MTYNRQRNVINTFWNGIENWNIKNKIEINELKLDWLCSLGIRYKSLKLGSTIFEEKRIGMGWNLKAGGREGGVDEDRMSILSVQSVCLWGSENGRAVINWRNEFFLTNLPFSQCF